MHNGGADIARKRRPVVENGGPGGGGGGAFPAAPVAESGVPGAASRAPPRSDTGSGDTATAAVGRRRATRVEGRRGERAAGGGRSADAYSSSSDSDFQFESSCSTCSSSDSELDASIYTETSGSCRSCAEAAVWEKFVDSKGNLFYLHPRPNPVSAESSRSKNGRDWKKTAGRRLKSFLKKKESNGDAAGDGARRDQDGRRDVWLRVAKKSGGGRSSAGDEQSLLEEMFGILIASAASGEKFICVSDLVPDSPAAVSGKIRQGDRLVAVNSEPVSPRNVEDILAACARKKQKKVKLTLVPASALEVENPLAPVFKSAVDAAAGAGGGGGGSRLRFDSLSGALSHPAAAVASPSAVPPSPSGTGTANVKGRPYWISAWDSSRPELETESRQQEADSSRSRGFAALFSLRGLGDGGGGGGGDVNRVLYSYPGQLVGWRGQLAKLRGALLTLSQMTADVICAAPVLSTVEISGTKAFVTYVVEGPDVLLLALCDDKYLSRSSMISRTCDLKRFLKLEFGTLGSMTSALVLGADKEDARSRVDAVFDVIFARPGQLGVGGGDGDGGRTRFEFLSSCVWECLGSCLCPAVPLKLGLRMQLDALLTDYEAGAWEYNVDFGANWLRGCYIVGSALFFKGYLLASHLNGRMLEEVFLLLRFRKLLEVTWSRAVDQLVVWQPIFSTGPGASEASAPLPSVQQKYLLVVGHGHQLFAVVLESTVFTVGRDAVAGPEYAYVQRGFKLLRQVECLRFTDVAAASVSAGVLSDGLGSVDAVLKSSRRGGGAVVRKNTTKGRSGDDQARRRRGGGGGGGGGGRPRLVSAVSQPTLLSGVGSELQRRSSMFRSHSQLFDVDSAWDSDVESSKLSFAPGRLRDVDELDSAGRVRGRQDTWARRGPLDEPAASSTPIPSSGSRSSSFVDESVKGGVIISLHPDDIEDCRVDYRVSRGPCGPNLAPAVFHFVAEMRGRGLIVCPAEGDLLERDTPAFRQVLEQFRFSVAVIRKRFRMDRLSAGLTKSRFALNEQGMMFTLKNFNAGDKKHSSHSSAKKGFCKFWVVGRLFGAPVDQELYVCHHDAVPQDFAEIAFRLMNKMAD